MGIKPFRNGLLSLNLRVKSRELRLKTLSERVKSIKSGLFTPTLRVKGISLILFTPDLRVFRKPALAGRRTNNLPTHFFADGSSQNFGTLGVLFNTWMWICRAPAIHSMWQFNLENLLVACSIKLVNNTLQRSVHYR